MNLVKWFISLFKPSPRPIDFRSFEEWYKDMKEYRNSQIPVVRMIRD